MDDEDKIFATGCLVWALGAILTVAFWVGVAYVAFHFLAKWW